MSPARPAAGTASPRDPDAILATLDDRQQEAVRAVRGPVVVIAGAGTGKTTVIAARIAYGVATGVYDPSEVLALAFSNRAAASLRQRLGELGVTGVAARTFHGAALRQFRHFWPRVVPGPQPRLLEGKARLIAEVAADARLPADAATVRDLAGEIEWRKSQVLSIDDYAQAAAERPRPPRLPLEAIVAAQRAYDEVTAERRMMDFEDVLLVTSGLLESEPRVATQIRAQYRHLTVDEYQDISPLSQRLLTAWLGQSEELCVVGDPAQAVYGFAGGDARFLLEFERRHPRARRFELTRNHRSGSAVLQAANALSATIPGAVRLEAHPDRTGTMPRIAVHADDEGEASAIADAVRVALDGGAAAQDIAVLVRTNAQAVPVRTALAERGIPTRLLGGRAYFDRPEIRQAVMALRAASLVPSPVGVAEQTADVLRSWGWTASAPPASSPDRERWDALAALLELARQAPAEAGFRAFTDELLRRRDDEREPVVAAVTIATLHAAKGLEWPVVHIAGLADGLLPAGGFGRPDEIAEERRLLYVGLTRARSELSLSWARSDPRGRPREESRFLAECGMSSPGAPPSGDRA